MDQTKVNTTVADQEPIEQVPHTNSDMNEQPLGGRSILHHIRPRNHDASTSAPRSVMDKSAAPAMSISSRNGAPSFHATPSFNTASSFTANSVPNSLPMHPFSAHFQGHQPNAWANIRQNHSIGTPYNNRQSRYHHGSHIVYPPYGPGYQMLQQPNPAPVPQWQFQYPPANASAFQQPQVSQWNEPPYGAAPGGGVWLFPQHFQPAQTGWNVPGTNPHWANTPNNFLFQHNPNQAHIGCIPIISRTPPTMNPTSDTSLVSPPAYSTSRGKQKDPKIHLPAPQPTKAYLDQAAKEPRRLDSPQMLLLVLDLNGTLVYRPNPRGNPKHIQNRPFLRPFLDYIFKNFSVMVWSSARTENVNRMLQGVLSQGQRKSLVEEWARDRFGLSAEHYSQNVQVYKKLTKIWNDPKVLAMSGNRGKGLAWGQHNTILLDDTSLKASSEPFNLLEVPEYKGQTESTEVLQEVMDYLEELRWQEDVSAFMRTKPFKANGQWRM